MLSAKGLLLDGKLYKDLMKFNCSTMKDVLACTWTEIRWEKDELNHVHLSTSNDSYSNDRRPKRPFQGPDR